MTLLLPVKVQITGHLTTQGDISSLSIILDRIIKNLSTTRVIATFDVIIDAPLIRLATTVLRDA